MSKAPSVLGRDVWAFDGVPVEIEFKAIKNIHISVLPPEGRARVSSPADYDKDMLRFTIQQRLGWIKTQQLRFKTIQRQSPRQFVGGESHYIFGTRYRLDIQEGPKNEAKLSKRFIHLTLTKQTNGSFEAKKRYIENWFKLLLAQRVQEICEEQNIQIDFSSVSIRKMKTKWFGSQPQPQKAWINLELIKEPSEKLVSIIHLLNGN